MGTFTPSKKLKTKDTTFEEFLISDKISKAKKYLSKGNYTQSVPILKSIKRELAVSHLQLEITLQLVNSLMKINK